MIYDNLSKKSEPLIIPLTSNIKRNNLNKDVKIDLKLALPLTDENDRANFMDPYQISEEFNDNNIDKNEGFSQVYYIDIFFFR